MTEPKGVLDKLESHAEVLKLARLLGAQPEQFNYLEELYAADLRELRVRITDVLFETNFGVLERVAGASALLPAPVLAKIAQRVFGPLLCARVAGLVEPTRAVDIAKRLPVSFLADVAAQLDPRRTSQIIANVPERTVTAVTAELVGRQDWVTLSRFVGEVADDTVAVSLDAIDDAGLLQVAFVLDDKRRINGLLLLLPEHRVTRLPAVAAEHELWTLAFDLVRYLETSLLQRFTAAVADLEPGMRAVALTKARELDVLDELDAVRVALEQPTS